MIMFILLHNGRRLLTCCPSRCVLSQSGETEPLDLGAPISSLDGLRVVLDRIDSASGKGKNTRSKNPW